MVELVGGGEVGAPSKFGGGPLGVTDGLPNPRNNIRVKNGSQLRIAEDMMAREDDDGGGEDETKDHVAALADEPPPDDPIAAVEDMVLTRDFLKLSSSRQHSEMQRRKEQDSRRRKLMERMETADESERALMQGRAARMKAQGDANKRLSASPSHAAVNKPLSIKESAIERSQMFLTAMPDLA